MVCREGTLYLHDGVCLLYYSGTIIHSMTIGPSG